MDQQDKLNTEFENEETVLPADEARRQNAMAPENLNRQILQPKEAPGDVPDIAGEYQWMATSQETTKDDTNWKPSDE